MLMKRTILIFVFLAAAPLWWSCGSGGSDGPSGPVPPGELSLLYCRAVEQQGEMHVQWSADVPTRGEIRYGRTGYTNLVTIPVRRDSQDVVLVGLDFSTHYVYRLSVYDSLDREAECAGDFTTPEKATPEPVITGVSISNITETSAQVTWRTDEPATSILYYGEISAGDSLIRDSLAFEHGFVLHDLHPSTNYHVRPEAVDSTNLRGYGRDTLFATAIQMALWFPDTVIALGDTVRVPIYLADAQDLAALRLAIHFTPGTVEVVAVEAGPFYSERGGFIFFSTIRNSEGRFWADLTWSVEYNGDERTGTQADGGGIVAYAALRGVDAGAMQAGFDVDSTFGLDMFANMRSCSLRAGEITVEPSNP
jgi:hypothetical protein